MERVEADGTTLPNGGDGGMDEVIRTWQSPSRGGDQKEDNDEVNDGRRCNADDEEVSMNTNVQSMVALGSKSNGEPSTGNGNRIAIAENGEEHVEEFESSRFGKKAKHRNELMEDYPKPPLSSAPRAPSGSSSQTWDGTRSLGLGHRLLNIRKGKQPSLERTATVLSSTDDEGNLTLAEIKREMVQHTALP